MKRSLLLILFCFAFLASKAQTTITNTTVIPESCKGAKDGKATVNVSFPTGIYDTIGYTKLIPPMTIEVVYHKITNIQATDNVTFEGLYGNQSSISVYGIKNGNVVSGSISSIGVVVGSGYDVQEPQVGVGALNQNIGLCEGQPLRLFSQSESGAGYKWRGPNAFTSTDQNPVIVNPQAANMGIYKVVASHIGNQGITCYSDTVSITPNIVDVPNPEFTIPSGVCQNEPLTLVVDSPISGVDAYAWKIPNGTPNSNNTQGPFNVTYSSVTGATPNIITLTVTKSGCMDSVKHSLHVRPKPTGSISSIQSKICEGATAQLRFTFTGTAPWDYTYSDGVTTYSGMANASPVNVNVTVNTNTTFTLTSVASIGCSGTVTGSPVNITVDPKPVVTIGNLPAATCPNGSPITLTGTPAGGVFSGPGVSGSTFNPLNSGAPGNKIITYTYTDGNSCAASASDTITVLSKTTATFTPPTSICSNASPISLPHSPAGGLFLSDGGGLVASSTTNNTFDPSTTTKNPVNLKYVFTSANGCRDTVSRSISIIPRPNASINVSTANANICAGQNSSVSIVLGGTPPFSYTYNNGTTTIGPITTNSSIVIIPVPAPAATVTYTLLGATGSGCTAVITNATAKINVNPLPVINFTSPGGPYCKNSAPITLVATPAGGTFSTIPAAAITGNQYDPSKAGANGTKTITYTYKDPVTNCTNTAQQTLTIVDGPTATFTASPNAVCPNTNVTVTYTGTGTAGGTYNWDFDNPSSVTGSGSGPYTVQWNTPGTSKKIKLSVSQYGCTASDSQSVVINQAPTATVSGTQGVCQGNNAIVSFNFTGTGPWNFVYNDGVSNIARTANTSPFVIAVPMLTVGTRTFSLVSVSDAGGCVGTVNGSAVVTVVSKPNSNFTLPANVCLNTATAIQYTPSSPTAVYTWSFAGGTPASASGSGPHNVAWSTSGPKTVSLVINESSGCISDTTKKVITVNPLPTATISNDTTVCTGNNARVKVTFTGTPPFSATLRDQNGNLFPIGPITSNVYYAPITVTANTDITLVSNSVTDGNGCVGTTSANTVKITVRPLPTAAISITGTNQVCSGDSVTLSIAFTGTAPFSYTYQNTLGVTVSGTTNSNPLTLKVAPGATTSYSIPNVGDAYCNNTGTGSATVTVIPKPTAIFTAAATSCAGSIITVTHTGTASPSAVYTWNFGGGTVVSGSGKGPYQIGFGTSGIKVISLTVSEPGFGCTSQPFSRNIDVKELPTASISGSQTVCQGNTANLQINFPKGTAPFNIVYTDGNTNYNATIATNPGSLSLVMLSAGTTKYKLVSVTDAFGCSSTSVSDSAVVKVVAKPTSDFSLNAGICVNNTATISYIGTPSASAVYTWSFGGGTPATATGVGPHNVTWNTTGNKTVSLVVNESSGCLSDTTKKNILVGNPPTATVSNDTTVCAGNQARVKITFTGAAPFSAIIRDNESGIQYPVNTSALVTYVSVNVTDSTTFQILNGSVSDANCAGIGNGVVAVHVNPLPTAKISNSTTICAGSTASVKIDFTGIAPFNYTYQMSTGGTVSGISNISSITLNVSPTATTTYKLLSISDAYCTGTVSDSAVVTVVPVPVVNFTLANVGCEGTPVQVTFTGTATSSATYNWSFGADANPVNATGVGPHQITYNTTGVKTVNLAVTDQVCNPVSLSKNIEIKALPTADISGTQGVCQGGNATLMLTFTGTAPWNFVYTDGNSNFNGTANASPFTLVLPMTTVGVKDFTLVSVQDANGCAGTELTGLARVTVVAKPNSDFTLDTKVCVNTNAQVVFAGTVSATAQYTWSFGPNATPTSANTVGPHTVSWSVSGPQTVSLVVNESSGCISDTTKKVIMVNPLPTATISNDTTVCAGNSGNIKVTFSGTAPFAVQLQDQDGTVYNVSSSASPVVYFPVSVMDSSVFTVVPNTTTDANCTGTGSGIVKINVNPAPKAVIHNDTKICAGQSTTFTIGFTGVAPFQYIYTDGTTPVSGSTSADSIVITVSPGTTTIYRLVSVSDALCTGTVSDSALVTVIQLPVADFTIPGAACENLDVDVIFSGTATGAAVYNWNFGTGIVTNGATGAGPYKVQWAGVGTYNVSLVINDQGCPSLPVSKSIVIKDKPSGTVVSKDTTVCERNSVVLKFDFNGLAPFKYQYTDGSGTSSVITTNNSSESIVVIPTSVPSTTYKLVSLVDSACAANVLTDSMVVTVKPAPTATFTVQDTICGQDTLDVTYTGVNFGTATFDWHGFDGATVVSGAGEGPFEILYNTFGDKTIKLTVSENGCADSTEVKVSISPLPTATITPDTSICTGGTASLKLSFTGTPTYTYTISGISQTFTSTDGSEILSVSPSATTTYRLLSVVDQNLCAAILTGPDAEATVRVNPLPTFDFDGKREICKNDSAEIYLNYTGGQKPWRTTVNISNPPSTFTEISSSSPDTIRFMMAISGEVSVSVTDSNQCTASSSKTLNVILKPVPTASFFLEDRVCEGQETFVINEDLPNPLYTYHIESAGATSTDVGDGNFLLTWSSPGRKGVEYRVFDGSCFSNKATDTIMVNAAPKASISTVNQICAESEIDVTLNLTGQPGFSFRIDVEGTKQNITNHPSNTYTFKTALSGTGTISVEYILDLNGNGCENFTAVTKKVNVLEKPEIVISGFKSPDCIDNVETNISANFPVIYDFSLLPIGSYTDLGAGNAKLYPVLAGVGAYDFTATYTNNLGCTDVWSDKFNVVEAPDGAFAYPLDNCSNIDSVSPNLFGGIFVGTFTPNDTALKVQAHTGLIYPALSKVGTYVITRTISGTGCATVTSTQTIHIRKAPDLPELANARDTIICRQTRDSLMYKIANRAPGDRYYWSFLEADTFGVIKSIPEAPLGDSVWVTWPASAYQRDTLSVRAMNQYNCVAQSYFTIYNDTVSASIYTASDSTLHPEYVAIHFNSSTSFPQHDAVVVARSFDLATPWSVVGSQTSVGDTVFYDQPSPSTSELAWYYKVGVRNYCGDTVFSTIHKTILVKGTVIDENKGQVRLGFNNYEGWPAIGKDTKYEIWRKLGDQDTFQLFANYGKMTSDTAFVYNDIMQDHREQCFRVKAIYDTLDPAKPQVPSYSNILCMKFANIPKIFNVFSPNGDGKNEFFYVDNIRSYPDNELYILNRWGNTIYHKVNYNNDWDGEGAPAGTYFYLFKVEDREENKKYEFKGNVLIVR